MYIEHLYSHLVIYETLQHSRTEFSGDEAWKMIGQENEFNADLMLGPTLNFISDIPGTYWLHFLLCSESCNHQQTLKTKVETNITANKTGSCGP